MIFVSHANRVLRFRVTLNPSGYPPCVESPHLSNKEPAPDASLKFKLDDPSVDQSHKAPVLGVCLGWFRV